MTNERLSLMLQIIGLLVVVVFSLMTRKLKLSIFFAVIIMIIVTVIAEFMIVGGGPAACMNVFALPVMGCFLAWVSIALFNYFTRKNE